MPFKIIAPHFYDLLAALSKKDRLLELIDHDENKAIRDQNPSMFAERGNSDRDQRAKLISLFSPTYAYDIFENLHSDETKRAAFRSIIRNLTGFLDQLFQLVVPENRRDDIEIDLDGTTTKLHVTTNGNQSNYHIENSNSFLDYKAIDFTTCTGNDSAVKQITNLTYNDQNDLPHDLLGDDKINVRPMGEYFTSPGSATITNESAFLFDKARRLLELKEHSQLGQYVPPLFFINPVDIENRDIFESRLIGLNRGGWDSPSPKLIVRSAHLMEGSADLPLSGVFTSIPDVEPNYDSFRAAVRSIKSDDLRLKRVNIGKADWEKVNMDDLGLIVMSQIPVKYFVKVEPVIYKSDRNSISTIPVSKQLAETNNVDFEVKIFAAGDGGPKDLLYRSSIKDLTQERLATLGISINPEQIESMQSIYKQSSDIYSKEYQEAEMLLTNDRVYLVQIRDQAAIEKHPDDAISEKLIRYELRQNQLTDDSIDLISNAFSDDPIPMIVIDESQALYRHMEDTGLRNFDDETKRQFVVEYKQRISELAGTLPRYQLFVKDLGITNQGEGIQDLGSYGELGLISAYEDIVAGSEVCFANDCHILRRGSRFHNLLFSSKSKRITVALPKETGCFERVCPDEKYGYNPRTGLYQDPGSPRQLIRQIMHKVKRSGHAGRLDIDISEASL